jgi:hypothetical protein
MRVTNDPLSKLKGASQQNSLPHRKTQKMNDIDDLACVLSNRFFTHALDNTTLQQQ